MTGNLFRRNSKRKTDSGGINGYGSESDDDGYYDEQDARSQPRGGGDEASHDDPPARSGIRGGGNEEDEDSYFPTLPRPLGRDAAYPVDEAVTSVAGERAQTGAPRQGFKRTPTGLSEKQLRKGGNHEINLEGGLDICLNVEVSCKDPAGITMPYRLLVPQLFYEEPKEGHAAKQMRFEMTSWLNFVKKGKGLRRWDHGDDEMSDGEVGGRERINARGL